MNEVLEAFTSESQNDLKDIEEREQLLDELADAVMDINEANNFCSGRSAKAITNLIFHAPPSLQWRAAEVVANCVQNNLAAQEYFMQAGIMDSLFPLMESDNFMCQLKALSALSCMVREYQPACKWFNKHDGVQKIEAILKSTNEFRLQRKCLALVDNVIHASSHLGVDSGSFDTPLYVKLVATSTSRDLRLAALNVLIRLVQHRKSSLSNNELALLLNVEGNDKTVDDEREGVNEAMDEEELLMVENLHALVKTESLSRGGDNAALNERRLIKAPNV